MQYGPFKRRHGGVVIAVDCKSTGETHVGSIPTVASKIILHPLYDII